MENNSFTFAAQFHRWHGSWVCIFEPWNYWWLVPYSIFACTWNTTRGNVHQLTHSDYFLESVPHNWLVCLFCWFLTKCPLGTCIDLTINACSVHWKLLHGQKHAAHIHKICWLYFITIKDEQESMKEYFLCSIGGVCSYALIFFDFLFASLHCDLSNTHYTFKCDW